MREVTYLLVILLACGFVAGYCPLDQIYGTVECSYRIVCFGTINDIKLPDHCRGSSNYDVKVDVTLHNASETFHTAADPDLLSMITTLTVHGSWTVTGLSFLNNMYKLKNLYITKNNIQRIINSPFRNLILIESMDLSHNNISDIEELFQFEIRPSQMRSISLAYNSIVEVPGDTFEELSGLIELDLSHNYIMELDEEPFCNLTHLQVLKLNNNRIKSLNGALRNLYNLRQLFLKSNRIQKIDMESINTINHLETFDISQNEIVNIDPTLFPRHWNHFSNHTICKIMLSDNHIVHVPNASIEIFERFRKNTLQPIFVYTKLDLSNNSIATIEYNAFSLMEPISLDLSHNKLVNFIVNPNDLVHVIYLNLSSNYLNMLHYESFLSMHNLQNFDLSHNFMEYFPDQSLSNTNNLKSANLSFNDILELHSLRITFHPEGGYLDLSNNGLSVLDIPHNETVRLRELVLAYNNISDAYLIRLTDQHNLTRLDMSHNFILELDESSLRLPEKLSYLDLSFNDIYRIAPSTFHRLNNLQTLRLSHNHLKIIEHGMLRGLRSLVNLDLSFNQIDLLDSKVFMDLKYLSLLSLRHNGLNFLDSDGWLSYEQDLMVYLDGNNLSCQWLAKALTDYKRGYSKMNPTVLETMVVGNSIWGIPCKQDVQNYQEIQNYQISPKYFTDERLLITSQKILEAVLEQTSLLKKFMWHEVLHEAEQKTVLNVV